MPLRSSNMQAAVNEFNRQVQRFVDNNVKPERLLVFYKRLTLEILRRVVFLTPVDTGRARGNWQLTIAQPATEQIPVVKGSTPDPVSAGANTLGRLNELDIVYISNNVPYIGFLERGSSDQAPGGMVAVTLGSLSEMFQKSLNGQTTGSEA